VTRFEESGGSGLLVVGKDLLVPFARAICVEIDLAGRRIVVDLPEGLKDLNQS
jgi:ribosomal 30S subunit maturation factor RimM